MKILIFLFYFVKCNDFWESIKEYITIAAAVNGMFVNNFVSYHLNPSERYPNSFKGKSEITQKLKFI